MFVVVLIMLHTTHQLEPPENTGRFNLAMAAKAGSGVWGLEEFLEVKAVSDWG